MNEKMIGEDKGRGSGISNQEEFKMEKKRPLLGEYTRTPMKKLDLEKEIQFIKLDIEDLQQRLRFRETGKIPEKTV